MVDARGDNGMSVKWSGLWPWLACWLAAAVAWQLARPLAGPLGPWVALACKGAIWLGIGSLTAWWVARERPVEALALGPPARSGLLRGIGWCALYLGATFVLGLALGERSDPAPAATWPGTLVNAVIEEAAFRGLILLHLARLMRFWLANLLAGLAFVAVHLPFFLQIADPPAIAIMSTSLLLLALALGAATRATRSIWIAVVAHAVNNILAGSP